MVNAYQELGLPDYTTSRIIRKKFLELAKQFHPDKNLSGCHARFQRILTAYETLIDPGKKSCLDRYLTKQREFSNVKRSFIPQADIIIPSNIGMLARLGLMKKGLKQRHREKYLGSLIDYIFRVQDSKTCANIFAKVSMTTRQLCPTCYGSNIHCHECDGKGSYKTSHPVIFPLQKAIVNPGMIHELNLAEHKPGPLIHFKKPYLYYKVLLVKT